MTLSRRTFVEGKRYETLVFQENTHPGDFEMVELQDIMNREREALAQNMIVDGFFADSFKVFGSGLSNAVNITPGTGGYSVGRRLILPDTLHPTVGGQYVYNMAIATPAINRVDLVYIDIFLEPVNATVDPDIQDPVLGPSALRERVRYNFAVSQNVVGPNVPTLPVGHVGIPLALITRRASDPAVNAADVEDVRPVASLNPQFKPKNLIVVSPLGGDFNDPTAALDSIVGLTSAANPYTILIRPGIYTVSKPLNFSDPYVSMIGTDPSACTIRGSFSNLSAAMISASNITIKNLTLDYVTGTGSHLETVVVTGSFSDLVLDNLVLAPFYYNENALNSFSGISMAAGGSGSITRCTVYAQNFGAFGTVSIGASSTIDMQDCVVTAAVSDALTVANGANLTLHRCSFYGTRALLITSGTMTATDCLWQNQVLKAFPVTGAPPLTMTLGVVNTMVGCMIDGLGADSTKTDTTLLWKDVVANVQFYTSGGGSSVYENVQFPAGIDINGTASRLIGCTFRGPFGAWAIAGSSSESVVVRGAISPVFIGCMFDPSNGKCILVLGGSPTLSGCRLTSSSAAARVINVLSNSTNVIVDSCLVQLFASYSLASPIFIGFSGGSARFTFTHNHVEGLVGSVPDYVLRGSSGTGAALFAGDNTSTAGALRDPATITTFTNIAQAP